MDIDDGRPTLRVSELERAPPAAASTAVFGAGAGAGAGVGTAQVVSADHPGNEASEGVDAGADTGGSA